MEAARRAVDLPDARLVDALLRHAVEPGLRLRDGRVIRSVAAALPADLQTAMAQLRAELERDPFAAPEASRLAELGLGPRQQATLVRAGQLMRITDGVLLLPGADARALAVLAGLGPTFTLSAARQALGTSRRVAVPLLELLARTGRTARTPDGQHPCSPDPDGRGRPRVEPPADPVARVTIADRTGARSGSRAADPYREPQCPRHARTQRLPTRRSTRPTRRSRCACAVRHPDRW